MKPLFNSLDDVLPEGVHLMRQSIGPTEQLQILDEIDDVLLAAPAFRPQMPTGPYMINSLTNCGDWGWFSDRKGYRYEERHPQTGKRWPVMPTSVKAHAVNAAMKAGYVFEPDACLVNIYQQTGKLSLHRDCDEADFTHPIVSLSFGHAAEFLLGGLKRSDPTIKLTLSTGDILIFGGASRLRYHGVRRIRSDLSAISHKIVPDGGRVNLTVRRAK